MPFSKLIVLISTVLIGSTTWAQSSATSYSSLRQTMGESSWSLGFGYGLTNTRFDHRESTSGLTSLGNVTEISANKYQLTFAKEFMGERLFSFSLLAEGGVIDGSGQDNVRYQGSSTTGFKEQISGTTYGAGLSANLNTYNWGFRIQPYISSKLIGENISSELSYGINSVANNVSTDFNMTGLEYSAGVRVYDASVSMMSFISVNYLNELSSSVSNSGQTIANAKNKDGKSFIKDTRFALAENKPERLPLSISAGFGFFF